MDRCYPTGCPPCDGPIDFPENPQDGDRFCIPIGAEGAMKCWVWDKCVPAWRAEGPVESSTRFRGALNPTVSEAENGITRDTPEDQWTGNPPQPPPTDRRSGDWWVVSTAAPDGPHPDFRMDLSGVAIAVGDRVYYDGDGYDKLPPPIIPYAEEAQDETPDPDNRVGGIVKLASVEEVREGTNKCNPVTPYTLKKAIPQPDSLEIIWEDRISTKYVPIASKLLTLNVLADALIPKADVNDPDIPAVGEWSFKYYDVTDGGETLLTVEQVDIDSVGFAYEDVFIKNFEITPVTGTRKVKAIGTFYDVYGEAHTVATPVLDVKYCNDMKITTQPADIDTQSATGPFSTSIVVEAFSPDLPFDESKIAYQWYIWDNIVEGKNDPDLNYDFAGWNTSTFTATRTSTGAETVQLRCEIKYGDDHPVYNAVFDADGKLVITDTSSNFTRTTRSHDAECAIDWQISDPCLLKGPTERIIKETTRTVVERETIKTVVQPRIGATIRTPSSAGGRTYLTVTKNQWGRVTSLRSSSSQIRVINAYSRRGKPDGSDRRLKKNIMSIGEYLS